MGDTPPDYMKGASCAMCGSGVHYVEGRVGCNACSLPTDCCLCPPQLAAPDAQRALGVGSPDNGDGEGDGARSRARRRRTASN